MNVLSLTSTLFAALSLSTLGQTDSDLRSQILLKGKQLVEIQKELADLRNQLNRPIRGSYIVKTGDTVHSIARRHSVSTSDIMKWNKISDPTKLGIGKMLIVSRTAKATIVETAKLSSPAERTAGYVVNKGDTFYSIARRHRITVSKLRALNPTVSTDFFAPGQTLQVTGTSAIAAEMKINMPVTIIKKAPKPVIQKTAKNPAPKKTSTAPLAKIPTNSAPISKTETVVKKYDKVAISTPPTPPVVQEKRPTAVSSIILTDETTFDAFASKHGTSTEQLNALNGWNLPKVMMLARGSEIFVPQ
jgi:LysM repeat protein